MSRTSFRGQAATPDPDRSANSHRKYIQFVGETSHIINGSKLPSNREVLQVFFHYMRAEKMPKNKAANLAADDVLLYWQLARIQTKDRYKGAKKLLRLHEEWGSLLKHKYRASASAHQHRMDFNSKLDDLFDVASATAAEGLNAKDRKFLENQRKKGRVGNLPGTEEIVARMEMEWRKRNNQEAASVEGMMENSERILRGKSA